MRQKDVVASSLGKQKKFEQCSASTAPLLPHGPGFSALFNPKHVNRNATAAGEQPKQREEVKIYRGLFHNIYY